jgi:alpha-D-ribose 1-methylphosphonate 5-triphosphate diphosphatase
MITCEPSISVMSAVKTARNLVTSMTTSGAVSSPWVGAGDSTPAAAPRLAEAIEHESGAGILRADHYLHLRCEVPAANCVETFDAFADKHPRAARLADGPRPGERQYASYDMWRRYMVGKGRVSEADLEGDAQRLKDSGRRVS